MHAVGLLDRGTRRGLVRLALTTSRARRRGWYGLRMWIEHGYGQFKSAGWQWQKTRITEPDRAGRMWLAFASATLWVVAVGGQREHDEGPQETVPELPATDTHSELASQAREGNDWSACCSKVSPSSWPC